MEELFKQWMLWNYNFYYGEEALKERDNLLTYLTKEPTTKVEEEYTWKI